MTTEVPGNPVTGADPVAETPAPGGMSRNTKIAAAVAAVVVVGGGIFAFQSLTDADMSALAAVPEDAHIVLTMDLLQLADSERLNALISTFTEPMADAGYIDDPEIDIGEAIAEELENELGIDLGDDVLSWVGRSMAIAVWMPADLLDPDDPDVILVLSVTDSAAADDFLRKVGDVVSVERKSDGDLYEMEETEEMVVWLGSDLMVIASNDRLIDEALASRGGGSLADNPTFGEVAAQLPGDRLFSGYVSGELFADLAEMSQDLADVAEADMELVESFEGAAFSVSLADEGLRADFVMLFEDGTAPELATTADVSVLGSLPADTIGFFAGVIPEESIAEGLATLRQADPQTYDEFIGQMSADLEVDIEGEVLPSIGGDTVLAVVPDRDGMLAVESGVDIGLLFSLGLVDADPMRDLVASLERLAVEIGLQLLPGDPVTVLIEGEEAAAYQVTDNALVIGSSGSVVADFVDGVGGLTGTDAYTEIDSILPGSGLSFFVDMHEVYDLIDMSSEDRAIAEPIRAMGAAASQDGDLFTSSFIMLIDYLP